jgi:lysozyme
MGLQGIDISEDQGTVDFAKVKASGIDFVSAKASEGLTLLDGKFKEYHTQAKAADLPFGAYHFFHFNDNPVTQAKFFLQTIDGFEGQLLPMVDVEEMPGTALELRECENLLGVFLDIVDDTLHGKRSLLYTFLSFWNQDVNARGVRVGMNGSDAFAGHPLWIAEYNSDAAPELPRGFQDWAIWQHTSSSYVPGIAPHVDIDMLNGDDLGLISR